MINIILISVITVRYSGAQVIPVMPDSVYTGNFISTNLYNDINLAYLNSVANYNYSYKRFGVSVGNYFLSNVSKLNINYFRDYNNFRFLFYYKVNDNFDAGAGLQNMFLSDDKNVETNQNNSRYYFSDLNLRLQNNVLLDTKLGFKTEDQIGEYNTGFSGILSGSAQNYMLSDYSADANLVLFYENLNRKQNHNYDLTFSLYKRFSREADNRGTVRYYNLRNDFFFPATSSIIYLYNIKNNIEKRSENYFYAGDNLNYSFTGNLLLTLGGFYVNRDITKEFQFKAPSSTILYENVYDTKILENDLELSAVLNYNLSRLNSQFKIIYNERAENHSLLNTAGLTPAQIAELEKAEKNKNNNSGRTSLILDLSYLISNTNTFGVSGSASALRYDTDFDENYDDRDEFGNFASIYHIYNNLINFNIETRFDIIFSRMNYIYSERSANNNKNKIYRLSSLSSYSPVKNLTTKNFVQVLANYTVYDYEDIISQIQSFSYRQLSIADSTTYFFTSKFNLGFYGILKYYEQGQFNNTSFSVKPIAYYEEQLLNPSVNYLLNGFVNIGIGFKFFQQDRYLYENAVKTLANNYKTYGPIGTLNFYLNNNSVININGGLEYVRYSNPSQNNSAVYLLMNILWNM
ncbi:MAG: hypothetical protein JNJ56_11790 [Ignavibacteria bacterium]|nr:hypothetical protein [Ignavibacteria bacterium]